MVSCDFGASSSQNGPNMNCLEILRDYLIRFTLLAGNLFYEDSKKENFVFSPLNIFHSFSLFHAMSLGETRNELCSIFGFPDESENATLEDFQEKLSELLQLLQTSKKIALNAAAGIFVQTESKINGTFAEGPEETHVELKASNSNLILNTSSSIRSILPEPSSTEDECLITSALHFSGQLENEFVKLSTKRESFETGLSTIDVDMMSQHQYVQYLDDPNYSFRILGLPYKNSDFSLYIQLPREDPKSTNFRNNFDSVYLNSFVDLSAMDKRLVHLKIPRFRVTTTSDLRDVLVKFGGQNIVTTPMLHDALLERPIEFVEVKHGASFELKETDAKLNTCLLNGCYTSPIRFFVNKPFSFFVYCNPMRLILLSGVISKPFY